MNSEGLRPALPVKDHSDGRTGFRERVHQESVAFKGDDVLLSVVAVDSPTHTRCEHRNRRIRANFTAIRAVAEGNGHQLAIEGDVKQLVVASPARLRAAIG